MYFTHIKTEADVAELKKRMAREGLFADRLNAVRAKMKYPVDGVLHTDVRPSSMRVPSNAELLALYRELVAEGSELANPDAELAMRKIKTKSNSGVAVVSLLTKPFPCPGRCTYCPSEVNMPKSYLSKEPAAARALANDFDPYAQVTNRLKALVMNGHPVEKIEMIVIGGTWSFYHPAYQEEFLIGCYRACNDFNSGVDSRSEEFHPRSDLKNLEGRSLDSDESQEISNRTRTQESRLLELRRLQDENETSHCRIIGLSIETRPDYITNYELVRLRMLGVTKVEIGVQHLDDEVLKLTKRDMKIARVKKATEMLRNAGFKIVYHMMPNLPGSTPERDISMFQELFSGPDFQPDMLKIYPCMVLEGSELYETWKEQGFTAYTDDQLIYVMSEEKKLVPPYVRILRVYRDIPASYIKAGSTISNLRQVMDADMKKNHWQCRCIRCREVREGVVDPTQFQLQKIEYATSDGKEIFLSFENPEKRQLASFTRLRLPNKESEKIFPSLQNTAFIRELHTYGRHTPIKDGGTQSQHVGFGTRLLREAERIAKEAGYEKLAVISGIGVRQYYHDRGYVLYDTYMVKSLI